MLKNLEKIIGNNEYTALLAILKSIGPESRTHRISVFIAGILRYAFSKISPNYDEGSLEEALVILDKDAYAEGNEKKILFDLVDELCNEAGITNDRVSSFGENYSISENTIDQYSKWHNMRWENF